MQEEVRRGFAVLGMASAALLFQQGGEEVSEKWANDGEAAAGYDDAEFDGAVWKGQRSILIFCLAIGVGYSYTQVAPSALTHVVSAAFKMGTMDVKRTILITHALLDHDQRAVFFRFSGLIHHTHKEPTLKKEATRIFCRSGIWIFLIIGRGSRSMMKSLTTFKIPLMR